MYCPSIGRFESNKLLLLLSLATVHFTYCLATDQINAQGYIIYCPCMGRFGNQAEQLLGSISFAKSLNRTLVLPPFIHYGPNHQPVLIPFESIIQVEPINNYHSVILMTDFMRLYADSVWPQGERLFFCYSGRHGSGNKHSCGATEGQPFNSFWTSFNISEDKTVFYSPLTTSPSNTEEWQRKWPISSNRVLTFVGAPSAFPTHEESIQIQKYIKLSNKLEKDAMDERRSRNFSDKLYLSMHIRHGSDWKRACELIKSHDGLTQMFSSSQCTGYRSYEKLKYEICFPSLEVIVGKLEESLNGYKLKHGTDIKLVHIATDRSDLVFLQNLKIMFPKIDFLLAPEDSETILGWMIDLYWMTNASVFIGNCISSFSAFPARIRIEQFDLRDTTHYFGYDPSVPIVHGEL